VNVATCGARHHSRPGWFPLRAFVTLILLVVASAADCFAGDIRPGTTVHVKANSIWFDEAAKLTRWQRLKKRGDAAALAAYEKKTLGERDAFQFIAQLTVKVLRYDRAKNQVEVQMTTPGRFQDTTWAVDASALEP